MKAHKLSAALSIVLLSGCMLGPDYSRPNLQLNDNYRGVTANNQAQAVKDIAWSEQFQDPEMSAFIRLAVERNLDLQIALTRIDAANAQNSIARSRLGPTLSGEFNTNPNTSGSSDNAYSFGA